MPTGNDSNPLQSSWWSLHGTSLPYRPTGCGVPNNQNIQQAVIGALFKTFGVDLDYGKVRLFLTDGAAYCLKAGRGLKQMFPNLLHVTCLCHGLNHVAETVRAEYPTNSSQKWRRSLLKPQEGRRLLPLLDMFPQWLNLFWQGEELGWKRPSTTVTISMGSRPSSRT